MKIALVRASVLFFAKNNYPVRARESLLAITPTRNCSLVMNLVNF